MRRAVLYLRVSTVDQTTANQERESTAYVYDWNILPIGQQLRLKELESYNTFPPLQAAESYNLSSILAEVKKANASTPGD